MESSDRSFDVRLAEWATSRFLTERHVDATHSIDDGRSGSDGNRYRTGSIGRIRPCMDHTRCSGGRGGRLGGAVCRQSVDPRARVDEVPDRFI